MKRLRRILSAYTDSDIGLLGSGSSKSLAESDRQELRNDLMRVYQQNEKFLWAAISFIFVAFLISMMLFRWYADALGLLIFAESVVGIAAVSCMRWMRSVWREKNSIELLIPLVIDLEGDALQAVVQILSRERPLAELDNSPQQKPIKILFLASNPKNSIRLRLDEEMREIDRVLRQSEFRDRFVIQQHWAVRVADLQEFLLRHKPDIVHFSGHGSAASEIILEDHNGRPRPVSKRALSQLFSLLRENIRCVILNACYSQLQAQAISEHIDCVIGMSKAIGDSAAIHFAASFYQALGYGQNVKTAFELGCSQIDLASLKEQSTPQLLAPKSDPSEIVFAE